MIKAALCLKHGMVPPEIHITNPNPSIPFASMCLRLPLKHQPLPDSGRPMLASVNSFGYGGTNGHAVLQAPPQGRSSSTEDRAETADAPRSQLFPISARSSRSARRAGGGLSRSPQASRCRVS